MTLNEALNTGKRFSRPALVSEFGYFSIDDIGVDVVLSASDVLATDYVVEPDLTFDLDQLTNAWNTAARMFSSVKDAHESKLFAELVNQLKGDNNDESY